MARADVCGVGTAAKCRTYGRQDRRAQLVLNHHREDGHAGHRLLGHVDARRQDNIRAEAFERVREGGGARVAPKTSRYWTVIPEYVTVSGSASARMRRSQSSVAAVRL